jgi:hypothetical protein
MRIHSSVHSRTASLPSTATQRSSACLSACPRRALRCRSPRTYSERTQVLPFLHFDATVTWHGCHRCDPLTIIDIPVLHVLRASPYFKGEYVSYEGEACVEIQQNRITTGQGTALLCQGGAASALHSDLPSRLPCAEVCGDPVRRALLQLRLQAVPSAVHQR